jgi:peptidoglycan/xylan/chitin deacetylase (PgdA/CDA1 family)
MKKKILITIDTEALPGRARDNHVDKLIWGKFSEVEMGIGRMIEIANKHSAPLTFFVDLLEISLYPNDFPEIARLVCTNGHDFQLHAHPHILPREFAANLGLSNSSVHLQTQAYSEKMFDYLVNESIKLTGVQPVSFRGGAFAFSDNTLRAMAKYGVDMSFNYSINSKYQAGNSENLPTFNWTNGLIEVPMSFLVKDGNKLAFEFSESSALKFDALDNIKKYIEEYFLTLGEDAVLVLLMHSWSLLSLDKESGFFYYKNDLLCNLFDDFLSFIKKDYDVISSVQLRELIKSKKFSPKIYRNIDVAKYLPEQMNS